MVLTFFGIVLIMGFFAFKFFSKINLPAMLTYSVVGLGVLMVGYGQFHKVAFYAEPGYVYHVRTILGEEKVVDGVADTGYNTYWWGRYNAWKRAITVQASSKSTVETLNSEAESVSMSASMPRLAITFLDQVSADAEATARFRLPTDRETFLRLVHEYRSPDNLLRASLIPAFQETMISTAQLMGAEEFFSGGRTQFNSEFDSQLRHGIYNVSREERVVKDETVNMPTGANASTGTEQGQMDDGRKVVFIVQKQLDENGAPVRKRQVFTDYGVSVVEARVTFMKPNDKFMERMQLKQKASADRAIAREQRIQEEEQRLLAIAKGEREVAERQAEAKVEQIEKTTNAETDKQLAITEAKKFQEQAEIQKITAAVHLEKAKLEAQTIRTLADADAYKKAKLLNADGALKQKLEALVQIAEVQANAMAQRKVPEQLFISGDKSGGMGNDAELAAILQTQLLKNVKQLNLDMSVK